MKNNIDTHILCEPYEIEDYLNKNNITAENFIVKTSELLNSINNSNYEDIDKFRELDNETEKDSINLHIPANFSDTSYHLIYQYSNKIELNKLLCDLKSNTQKIFDLKINCDLDDAKSMISDLKDYISNIKNGNVYETKIFEKFSDLASYNDALNIVSNQFYSSIYEWISSFPSSLIDMQLNIKEKNKEYVDDMNIDKNISKETSESILIKKELLYLIYELYNSLIVNIIEVKTFWNSFFDLIEPENEVTEFSMNDSDDKINMILNELENITEIEDSEEFFGEEYGSEEGDLTSASKGGSIKQAVSVAGKFFKEFPNKVNKTRKQFKLYRMRAKNHAFYMKYMGRIDGLYERYADEATVTENGMIGDPVEKLKDEAHEYITNVSNEFVNMQHDLIDLSKKFASTGDPKQMLEMLKHFGGMYMNDVNKANSISEAFEKSLRFKVGEIITKGNKIYGYNPQSIAENKKLPPSNHAIISLFVDRPDEKPYDQKVSDIIKDPKSFKLIAENEKEPIFETSVICSDILTKGIQSESYKQLKINRKNSKEKFELNIKELTEKAEKPKKERKKLINQFKACWKALEKGYDYSLSTKNYIADLVQSYFVMMTRIDNLCKICLTSLLHVETMHRDESYNTGYKADSLKSHQNYQQYSEQEENRKTKGEKEIEEDEQNKEYKEKMKNNIRNRTKEISNAMAKYRY